MRIAKLSIFSAALVTVGVLVGWPSVGWAFPDSHVDPDRQDPWTNCTSCHGADLLGGFAPACNTCHNDFSEPDLPPRGHHPTVGDPPDDTTSRLDPLNNCAMCHGNDLTGGFGPSCFTCHDDLWSGGGGGGGGGNSPPVADPGGPYTGVVGQPITFDGSGSSDPDGDPLTYVWLFDDGTPPQLPRTDPTITHTFDEPGEYTVTLTVTDGVFGNFPDIKTTTVTITETSNLPPTADAGGPYSGVAGQPVSFDGSGSSDPDGDTLTFHWDFDDGETATGAKPSHTFDSEGTYQVILTVDDGVNAPVTDMVEVTIDPPVVNPPPSGNTWQMLLPLIPDQGTVEIDSFISFLWVKEKMGDEPVVYGVGLKLSTIVAWIDLRGSFFVGTADWERGLMMGVVFNYMGGSDSIWMAQQLALPLDFANPLAGSGLGGLLPGF